MSRVLILSDDVPFAASSAQTLRSHAHSVSVWNLAAFDTERARDFDADVIVLDTPGNGVALALRQRLLRDRALCAVPLLVVTESAAEAQLLVAQGMVTKPVEPQMFEQLVVRLSSQQVLCPMP